MINEQLRPLAVPIDSLVPDPGNARDHDERNMDAIKQSLDRFGQQKCIVVNEDGVIIAGNGTWAAAKELGWNQIAAVKYDGKGEEVGFALADNRTGELSRWNHEQLASHMKGLNELGFDVEALGWKDYEIAPLLAAEWKPPELKTDEAFEAAGGQGQTIRFTSGQKEVIDRAVEALRAQIDDPEAEPGRCLELICADWLAGQ